MTKRYFNIMNGLVSKKEWRKIDVGQQKTEGQNSRFYKKTVGEFYLLAEISHQCPSKRDVVKISNSNGSKTSLQKHVMIMTLAEAYAKFKALYPDTNITCEESLGDKLKDMPLHSRSGWWWYHSLTAHQH